MTNAAANLVFSVTRCVTRCASQIEKEALEIWIEVEKLSVVGKEVNRTVNRKEDSKDHVQYKCFSPEEVSNYLISLLSFKNHEFMKH